MYKPHYKLTNEIANNIARISADREAILRSPILPSIEDKLRKDALISRTHHSTSIEGNPLSQAEVAIIIDGGKIPARPKDKQEIINYVSVLKYLDSASSWKEITVATILRIQALATKNILSAEHSGKYRDRMVYVVDRFGRTVFTPPDTKFVPGLARNLTNWLNSKGSFNLHPILVAGIAHYELVRIHPFIDGNGRTARALATLILYQRDFDIKHFFALDDYYNEDREAYYTALQYVNQQTLDLTQWLEYFTEGVTVQMSKLKKKIESLAHEPILKKLKKRIILKERQWKLLEQLKKKEMVTNLEYQNIAGISREMAKRDLTFLVGEGILKRFGKGRRVYYKFL